MPQWWLLKTEPTAYSFEQLERDGRTVWDGVKNPLARKHLRAIRSGDRLFVYHTGDEKAVVGTARASSAAYPEPGSKDAGAVVVDLVPVGRLKRPVTLAELR